MRIEEVILEQIKQEIKMFESERLDNDILNKDKYICLYIIYYRLQLKINEVNYYQ